MVYMMKGLWVVNKTPNFILLFSNEYIISSFWVRRGISVDLFLWKPNWESERTECLSKKVISRERIIFSRPLQNRGSIDTGRYFVRSLISPPLYIGVTFAICIRTRKWPLLNARLKTCWIIGAIISMTCLTGLICKSFTSWEWLFLIFTKAVMISLSVV